METRRLGDRACLCVGGDGATEFLQNLVTCDVARLAPGDVTFGALLTPQGKILFDFLIVRGEADFLIDTHHQRRDELVRRLMFYRLRAPVEIAADPSIVLVGDEGLADPRSTALARRSWGDRDAPDGTEAWHAERISGSGVPECTADYRPETTFPHEALMDCLPGAGVEFTKGCYVGQEVVSRMQHRGTARSRFLPVIESSGVSLPPMGTELLKDGRRVGVMGSSCGSNGLALLRIDKIDIGDTFEADGAQVCPVGSLVPGFRWPATS